MNPPDFETNQTGTFARMTTQNLTIYRLRETCRDLLKVIDELMPGIGHVVCDIGFLNETLINTEALLKELEDEEHERTKSQIGPPDESALSNAEDEPGQVDQPDEGTDRPRPDDGSDSAGPTDSGTPS